MAYNLMVVDDSPTMRGVIKKTLQLSGVEIGVLLEAGNGREALEKLENSWVDLILTDLYMPEMDGLELIKRIREHPIFSATPIIVVSTEGREARIDEICQAGVAGFVHKPFRPEVIRDLIAQCLGVSNELNADADSGECDF